MPFWLEPMRPQVDEPQSLVVHALRHPAQHAAAVAVDAVPHHLPHEAADLPEAGHPVELGHAHRHLVAAHLRDQRAVCGVHEVRLSRGGAEPGLGLHPLHEPLEVARRQVEVQVELAEVVESAEVHGLETGVERLHHARPHAPPAAVVAADDLEVRQTRGVLGEDLPASRRWSRRRRRSTGPGGTDLPRRRCPASGGCMPLRRGTARPEGNGAPRARAHSLEERRNSIRARVALSTPRPAEATVLARSNPDGRLTR